MTRPSAASPDIPIALCVGPGPGPKNVLVQIGDRKTVVTWRTWQLIRQGKIRV